MSVRDPGSHEDDKVKALEVERSHPEGTYLTTDQGIPIAHTDDSLKPVPRGPTLLEDFHFREKLTRFDHERIPERVVHARGSGAHGYFQVYEPLTKYTKARFLQDPSLKTPVFVRFSTVAGSRGSADTVRDVRGFAVKFYTQEGNFDLVGNNIPVFFIQDGIKFPDVVHAVKPEPHHEMPQAASAHDSFWDFASLVPETAHMLMWIMSDRALPRSYRMMEGFGVHTFRLINAEGKSRFVKFHWKPLLGVHSLVWDEAQKLAGKDPDFHRRDLWEAIEMGDYPEYELGVQIIEEEQAETLGFDLLDATKLVTEELIPVRRIGKLVLHRNPTNFFAETEQVAFCVSNVVPGIDFTNDPLMQARLFSYLDTQLTRLGGPNFAEIPINRPLAPVHNHQQDGFHRHTIDAGRANYHPNSLSGGCPFLASTQQGFTSYPERVEGEKLRIRSESFKDHFSQAALFFRSLTEPERNHLVEACKFELGKVERKDIRERVVKLFAQIDGELALRVAEALGLPVPPPQKAHAVKPAPSLSQETAPRTSIKSRRVAVLAADGVSAADLAAVKQALLAQGAQSKVISRRLGTLKSAEGNAIEVDKCALTTSSVEYDAVYVPGGAASVAALLAQGDTRHFILEAYRHCKPIGATGEGVDLLRSCGIDATRPGVVASAGGSAFVESFIDAIRQHRHWGRDDLQAIPA
ncbi:catalase [Sorangium sp. So ce388]|uniref:catalase n=1 Tax=Sorangium sp. So ce388 TaxID=3133309 RepID=UPI003F5BFB79